VDSVGSSLGLPQNFLQEFIAFFGDTLIEKAGARHWAEHAMAHHSSDEIEKQLDTLLKEYAMKLMSKPPSSWVSDGSKVTQQVQDPTQSHVLTGATILIRRYRPKIARYFRDNAVSVPVSAASLSARLKN
jgi:Rad3-related DNA helicase